MSKFEACSCNGFLDIMFSVPNLQRAITKKNIMIFFLFSPGNLLIISYKLSKFEAPSCYSL